MPAGVPVRGRWGSVPSGLVPIRLGSQVWNVAADQAGRFLGFLQDAQAQGLIPGGTITSSGGYNDRQIFILGKPTGRASNHAYGTAIDLNAAANAQGAKVGSIDKEKARTLAAKWGLRWGGTFPTPDFMHFEVQKGAPAMPLGSTDITDRPANRTPTTTTPAGQAPTVGTPTSPATSPSSGVQEVGWHWFPGAPGPVWIPGAVEDKVGEIPGAIAGALGLDDLWSNVSRIVIGGVIVAGGVALVVLGSLASVDAKGKAMTVAKAVNPAAAAAGAAA